MSKKKLDPFEFPKKFKDLPNTLSSFYIPEPEVILQDQIITINNFFKPELCQDLIKSFETKLKLETTPLIKSKDYAARYNDRALVNDLKSADTLWQYMKQILASNPYDDPQLKQVVKIFSTAIGLNPQLRIYRYTQGHHFGAHYDDSVVCTVPPEGKIKGKTDWTLLIYLTGDDEFKGGGTIFYPDYGSEALNIHPSKGMALLHKHGDACLRHEAELVKKGVKWVLRSDVIFPK
ncbi:hypothetical protein CANMA_004662 [Candida margitis]|uniref:uncharacterized protein n=1 Tax=Candida margitis TaxID=1775924 RepID=UPI0022277995|nr:uncharacterized protein CANMA_004662 [Candida margitis]KAI5953824.1 hypothetical protein CANMA_004662 [Candida margitis]